MVNFMTTIGPEVDEIYDSFNLTDEQEQDMDVVVDKFTNYFTPPSNIDYQIFLFDNIKQQADEKANEFVARIKVQADKCELGTLRDRFVKHRIISGTKDKDLQNTTEKMCRMTETTGNAIWWLADV
jgi:hypothetical protein